MKLSSLVRTEVTRRFAQEQVEAAVEILEGTPLPFLDVPTRASDRQRVQLAAIKFAAGDLDKLREATDLARIDWRDLLMGTGLGGGNWRAVLERDGFPIP